MLVVVRRDRTNLLLGELASYLLDHLLLFGKFERNH